MSPLSLFAMMVEEQAAVARPFAAQLFQTGTFSHQAVQGYTQDGMTVMQQAFGVALADALAEEAFNALKAGRSLPEVGTTLASGIRALPLTALAYSLDAFKARIIAHGDDPILASLSRAVTFGDSSTGRAMTTEAKIVLARSIQQVLAPDGGLEVRGEGLDAVAQSLSDYDKTMPDGMGNTSTRSYFQTQNRFAMEVKAEVAPHSGPVEGVPSIPNRERLAERQLGLRDQVIQQAHASLKTAAASGDNLHDLGKLLVEKFVEHGLSSMEGLQLLKLTLHHYVTASPHSKGGLGIDDKRDFMVGMAQASTDYPFVKALNHAAIRYLTDVPKPTTSRTEFRRGKRWGAR